MSPFAKGVATGMGAAMLVAAAAAALLLPRAVSDAKLGWNLVPVVVAAENLPAGTVLEAEHLSQQVLPEQFASEANIHPRDIPLVLGKRTPQALESGEPLVYSSFASEPLMESTACVKAILPEVEQAYDEARVRTLERLRAGAGSPLVGAPPPLDENAAPGPVQILVAKVDLEKGSVLEAAHVTVRELPARWITGSMIRAVDRQGVEGARLTSELLAGDWIRWQELESQGQPPSVAFCTQTVRAARKLAASEAAGRLAGRHDLEAMGGTSR